MSLYPRGYKCARENSQTPGLYFQQDSLLTGRSTGDIQDEGPLVDFRKKVFQNTAHQHNPQLQHNTVLLKQKQKPQPL